MTFTYLNLTTFNTIGNAWLKKNPQDSKLGYAIKKQIKLIINLIKADVEELKEILRDIEIDSYAVDGDGNLIKDANGFKQSREGLRTRLKREKEAIKAHEAKMEAKPPFEISPYIITELPILTEEEIEAFKGIVIKEDYINPPTAE